MDGVREQLSTSLNMLACSARYTPSHPRFVRFTFFLKTILLTNLLLVQFFGVGQVLMQVRLKASSYRLVWAHTGIILIVSSHATQCFSRLQTRQRYNIRGDVVQDALIGTSVPSPLLSRQLITFSIQLASASLVLSSKRVVRLRRRKWLSVKKEELLPKSSTQMSSLPPNSFERGDSLRPFSFFRSVTFDLLYCYHSLIATNYM